jgi:AraC-like DNA-binding protein
MDQQLTPWAVGRPHPALRGVVDAYLGYRMVAPVGIHRGLPSGALTFIVSLADDVAVLPGDGDDGGRHGCVVGGLHTRPARIARGGLEEGVAVVTTPLGSRRLFGCPAAALAERSFDGDDVLGAGVVRDLRERAVAAPDWRGRFAALDQVLREVVAARPRAVASSDDPVDEAWRAIAASHGALPITEVAAHVGWGRRHLSSRFRDEFGVTPKQAARAVRFGRTVALLRRDPGGDLAQVAAEGGFYDQAHLTREFRDLAGCPPTTWLREEFPSVQAAARGGGQAAS